MFCEPALSSCPCLSTHPYALSLFMQSLHIQILIWHFSPIYFLHFAHRFSPFILAFLHTQKYPPVPSLYCKVAYWSGTIFLLLIHLYVLEVSLVSIYMKVFTTNGHHVMLWKYSKRPQKINHS